LWSCDGKGPVSKTAAHPTDNKCLSVGRTQLSDTGVSQVNWGIARQGLVHKSRNLENDTLPHRKPVQLGEHRRDMITSPGARHKRSELTALQAACQFGSDAVAQRLVTKPQSQITQFYLQITCMSASTLLTFTQ